MRDEYRVVLFSILFGATVWITVALIDSFFFHNKSFLDDLLFNIPPHALYLHLILFISFVVFAYVITGHNTKQNIIRNNLKTKERQLADSQKVAKLGSWEWDVKQNIITWSDELYNIFGLSPDNFEATYESFLNMVHPDDVQPLDEAVKKSLADGNPYHIDARIIRQDGSEWIMEARGVVSYDTDGKPLLMGGTAQDITARKQAETALLESEEKYRTLIETANVAIFLADAETGIILDANKKAEELIGTPVDEIRGLHQSALHPDDEAENYKNIFREHILQGHGTAMNLYVINKSGELIPVDINTSITELRGRKVVQGIFRDMSEHVRIREQLKSVKEGLEMRVTERTKELIDVNRLLSSEIEERIRIESALRESEKRFRSTFEDAGIGIANVAADGSFISVNKRVCQIFGYGKDTMLNMKLWDLGARADMKYCRAELLRLAKGDVRKVSCEQRNVHKSGRGVWTSLSATAFRDESDSLLFLIVLFEDITEKRALEEEARLLQSRLIHTNKMTSLGTLVSGVAHEINNPNSFIMSNAEIFTDIWSDAAQVLVDRYTSKGDFDLGGLAYSEMNGKVPKLLQGIHEGTQRIKSIVDNLRDFARPDSAGMNGTVDINVSVRKAISILDAHIKRCTNAFSVNYEDNLPIITGNSQQIEQVVINLIINSLQALADKKKGIKVSTYFDDREHVVIIKVRDEGAGMSSELLERITEPFFTTKLEDGGSGLGLSISYSIAREHRGLLDFQSRPGKGTTAFFKLPAGRTKESGSEGWK